MNYILDNILIRLTVSTFGAEMQSIIKDNIEYLWQGDIKYWNERAINLFPYCGRHYKGKYTFNNDEYEMKLHGLAKYYEFNLISNNNDSLSFSFEYNEETLKNYPFKFEFIVEYKLINNKIIITYKVINKDEKRMYFAIGAHPGFNVPINKDLEFEDYYIEFEEKCNPSRISYSDNGLVLDGYDDNLLKDNQILYLKHNLFDNDMVDYINAYKSLSLKTNKDNRMIKISYPDMKYVGFWHKSKTDAPYVCIEPWTSLPSKEGEIEEMTNKKDFIELSPNNEYINKITIELF